MGDSDVAMMERAAMPVVAAGLIDRFVSRTRKATSGCLEWQGCRVGRGYGMLAAKSVNGRANDRAHRVAYRLFVGPITEGLYVLHNCDNPACVSPAHLHLGTHTDNMRDMTAKGRGRPTGGRCKGTRHWNSSLNDDDIRAIRAMAATGRWTQQRIAALFGIVHTAVSAIVRGEKWSHVS